MQPILFFRRTIPGKDMSDNPAFDLFLNVAATYAEKLLTATALRACNLVRGSPQARALGAAYAVAFRALLAEADALDHDLGDHLAVFGHYLQR